MFFCCVCEVYRCFLASGRSLRAFDDPSAWTFLDVWTVDDRKTGRIWCGSVPTLSVFLHEQLWWRKTDDITENANKWSCFSSASGTETVAVPQTDGSYKLHGFKWFTSATDADMTLTLARVQDRTGATTPVFLTSDASLTSVIYLLLNDLDLIALSVCLSPSTGEQGSVFVLRRGEQRWGWPAEGDRGSETEGQARDETDAHCWVTAGRPAGTQSELRFLFSVFCDKIPFTSFCFQKSSWSC